MNYTLIQKGLVMEKYVLTFLVSFVSVITPAFYWFFLVGFFTLADFGVKSLIVIKDNPEKWVSGRAWRTAYKLGISLIFIIAAFVAERYIVKDIPVMKIMGSYLILMELKSLDEKAKIIFGISLFGFLIEKLTPKK